MAKTLANYDPLVQIPSGMTPAGADFPIVESHDILVGENDKRLDAKLDDIDSAIGNVGTTPIATQLSSKVNTGDIVASVAATGSTSNNKIPSETAVRAAIEAKTINVDSTVTEGSANAVSGGAVHTQLATKQDKLTFDTTPTASSSNPVTSGGVKAALDTKQNTLTFDTAPTASSSNPVTSGGVKAALDTKQNTLTYETTPIAGSVNPVTSTGIRNAIDAAAASNLGQMQATYAKFVADADAVLDRASSLSNGMVACSNIVAETTVGDTRILLYTGTTNANYTNGHWYYNSAPSNQAPSWTDGGAVGSAPTIDNTLTVEGAAANSKAVGDAIENIVTISNTQPGSNSGNKVWIKETTDEEVQIPTYEEHISKANKADITTNNESDNGSGTITASKAYAIGDHFYINNTNTSSENYGVSTLYKATAAIASGSAIVVGTNCEASKVADEITSLSNDIDTVKADLGAQANGKLGITLVEGKYVNPSSGQYISRTGAYAIDYVDCIPGDTVLIVSASASAYGAFYNASKERVASLSLIAGNNYIKVPDTAYFFATSTHDSSVSSIQIYSKIGTDTKNLVEKVEYFDDTKALAIGTKKVVTGNLYSASDATQGYYLNGTAGTPVANENYAYTGYIPLDGDSYAYSSNVASTGIYFYNEDYNLLSPLVRALQNYTSADTWPMGTKYCRFNLNVSIINAITFTTSKNTGYYISEAQIVKNEYNINVGSTRTYATLKSAVDYINSIGDDTATYNILLDAGTYNALDGYDLSTQASTFMGLVLPDNTNIIGQSSPANVIIAIDGTNFPDNINKNEISVINLYRNNIIKNVTVKSKNIRYGLHDDDSYRATGAVSDAIQIFENVHFINEAKTVTGTASYCAGIGAKKGQTLTFKNCIFENQDTTYCALSAHNGTTSEKPVTYNFQNCKFACNGSYGLRLTTTAYNILNIVNLHGCKSNKNILLDRTSSNENTNTGFKFFGHGNSGLAFSVSGIVLNDSDTEMML